MAKTRQMFGHLFYKKEIRFQFYFFEIDIIIKKSLHIYKLNLSIKLRC
jgi:hypothetical protein